VLIVGRERLADAAAQLRAAGVGEVVGDAPLIPPPADLQMERLLARIFRKAERMERGAKGVEAERLRAVMEAAAVDSLRMPADLRARLRARDRRRALWVRAEDPVLLAGQRGLEGSSVYRVRGSLRLRREGRVAGLLAYVAGGLVLVWRLRRGATAPALAGAVALLAGGFTLHLLDTAPHPVLGGATHPLLAVLALGASWTIAVPLAAATALAPRLLGPHALALLVTALVASAPALASRLARRSK
ncbi:MAG: hypothetical protein ACE5JG_05505, partial [Planctomycetota bacterium]